HADDGTVWKEPSGRGLALGFAQGIWGGLYGTDVHASLPVGTEHFRILGRFQTVQQFGDPYIMLQGARLEIWGGSLPISNIVRGYGGGGFGFLAVVAGPDGIDKAIKFGAGGHFGIEVFLGPALS